LIRIAVRKRFAHGGQQLHGAVRNAFVACRPAEQHEVRDAVHNNRGLSASRPGKHQQRAFGAVYGAALRGVKEAEVFVE
jgi:hypothetical protein